jgi:hypothetical protein
MISEMFWQCGIFLHDFGTVLTVWYISTWFLNCSDSVVYFYMIKELLWQSCIFLHMYVQGQESELSCICVLGVSVFADFTAWFRNCSDSLIFFYVISELFWQSGIFRYDFGAVLTVWYFLTWFRNFSDSVVFCYMISELFWQCSISYMISELFWHCDILRHDFGTVLTVWYFPI